MIEPLREELDSIDQALIALLARRAQIVRKIWQWKDRNGVPRVNAEREREMRGALSKLAHELGLDAAQVERVFGEIIGKDFRP